MGKIATIGEIQAHLGLPNPPSGWASNRCPTKGELSLIWGDDIAWAGFPGYDSNRLVELDMVIKGKLLITITGNSSAVIAMSYDVGLSYLVDGVLESQQTTAFRDGTTLFNSLSVTLAIPTSATSKIVRISNVKFKKATSQMWIIGKSSSGSWSGNVYTHNISERDLPPIEDGPFTIKGTLAYSYYLSHNSYVSTGTQRISPIELSPGMILSDGGAFSHNTKIYVRNAITGFQTTILALHNVPGGSVTIDTQV